MLVKNNNIVCLLLLVLLIPVTLNSLKLTESFSNGIFEPLLLSIFSGLLFMQIIWESKPNKISLIDILVLCFITYVTLKNLLSNTVDIPTLSYLYLAYFIFCGLRYLFANISNSLLSLCLVIVNVVTLAIYIFFVTYQCTFKNQTCTNLFVPNISVFSILLSSQISFSIPLYIRFKTELKFISKINLVFIILAIILLIFTNGRAGWIGLILSLAYISSKKLINAKVKKRFRIAIIPLLILLVFILFFYKSNSSNGRILIYKASIGMLKNNWLSGIGFGQFKVKYNEYQAAYFATHNIDKKDALLADNTYYAFNDFYQALIETGLIGFVISCAILYSLYVQIKKFETNTENENLFISSVASLICIFVGSLFSYPFHNFSIIIQLIFCCSTITSLTIKNNQKFKISKKINGLLKPILIIFYLVLFTHFCFYLNYKNKCSTAFELNKTGFKAEASAKYSELSKCYIKEGNILFQYAQNLYYSNQTNQAEEVLKRAKHFYISNEVLKLSASIELELKKFEDAENDYKTAVYMVPNRILSRNELLNFYLERKDTINATYWAESISKMTIKIPSSLTYKMQQNAKDILIKLKR